MTTVGPCAVRAVVTSCSSRVRPAPGLAPRKAAVGAAARPRPSGKYRGAISCQKRCWWSRSLRADRRGSSAMALTRLPVGPQACWEIEGIPQRRLIDHARSPGGDDRLNIGFVPVIDRAQKVEEGLGRRHPQPVGFALVAVLRQLGDAP